MEMVQTLKFANEMNSMWEFGGMQVYILYCDTSFKLS